MVVGWFLQSVFQVSLSICATAEFMTPVVNGWIGILLSGSGVLHPAGFFRDLFIYLFLWLWWRQTLLWLENRGLIYRHHAAVGHSWHGVHEEIGVLSTPEHAHGKKKINSQKFCERLSTLRGSQLFSLMQFEDGCSVPNFITLNAVEISPLFHPGGGVGRTGMSETVLMKR